MVTWIVEGPDHVRSRERAIDRIDFFVWWKTDGLFEVPWQREEHLWPPEIFQDKVAKQIDYLISRWWVHSANPAVHIDFCNALATAAEGELGVFCWQEKKRYIRRADFITWYEASSFVATQSAIAEIQRAVKADDLWPQFEESKDASASSPPASGLSWKDLSAREAINLALREVYPAGIPHGTIVKVRNAALTDCIVKRGGRPPNVRTYRRNISTARKPP